MVHRMEALEVVTDQDGKIRISQDDYGDGGNTLFISPDQVDILCQWLKEERDKIKENLSDS